MPTHHRVTVDLKFELACPRDGGSAQTTTGSLSFAAMVDIM